jgi:BirA family biotin operon repressor/biotin-[acetyl-CoA-carboxylase] ligase
MGTHHLRTWPSKEDQHKGGFSLKISCDSLQTILLTKNLGKSLLVMEECTSTNALASLLASQGARHGLVVVAEKQTKGRGRHGREWISPEGGIWMTAILRPPLSLTPLDGLPLVGALAVCLALNKKCDIRPKVRWPNDVVLDHLKLAGVLVEAKIAGNAPEYALLGLGLNANFHTSLIRDWTENATTVLDILGSPVDRAALISSILLETEQLYDWMNSEDSYRILELLRMNEASQGSGVVVELENGRLEGTFEDFETLTRVRVRDYDGSVRSLEISSVVSVQYAGASRTRSRME